MRRRRSRQLVRRAAACASLVAVVLALMLWRRSERDQVEFGLAEYHVVAADVTYGDDLFDGRPGDVAWVREWDVAFDRGTVAVHEVWLCPGKYGDLLPTPGRAGWRFECRDDPDPGWRPTSGWHLTSVAPVCGGWQVYRHPGEREADVPVWALAAVAALLPAWRAGRGVHRRRRVQAGRCPVCGYDLRATPDRCPECGTTPTPAVT